jgi:mannose-6-phosphate isomerase-like protein (cupin superfamily)
MRAFILEELVATPQRSGRRYVEFLRVPALSAGIYSLPVGGFDPQAPHQEDEVYHVLRGRAVLRVENADLPVVPGSIVYVPARVPHRFHSITEELQVLVWFAPAESSGGT